MTQLNNIVDINILRETARVSQVGFGVPLILGPHFHLTDRVRTYTDPADMLTDGFLVTDAHYLSALALMSQDLSPTSFKVGRKLEDVNAMQTVTFTGTPSAGTWTMTLGAQTTGALAYDIAAGALETALELLSNITSVTVTGTMAAGFTVEFDGADAATAFDTFTVDVSSLTGVTAAAVAVDQVGSAVEVWTAAINAVLAADADWFCLLTTSRTKADILALAVVIEATANKMFVAASADADILTSAVDDLASELQDFDYDWIALIYCATGATQYPDAAWAGRMLPTAPGSATWKFKALDTITPDALTAAELGYLVAKACNYYETVAGLNMVSSDAVVASGEYIDVMRGIGWLGQRMAEDIFTELANAPKIPMTNAGVGQVVGLVRNRLERGEDVGLISPNTSVVNSLAIDDVPSADRANRLLTGITFSGLLAGAVHRTTINGKVTVS